MESFKQKRANLLKDNPIASHGSWISKHSIAAGSPVHMGGSGKSPLYEDEKSLESVVRTKHGALGGQMMPDQSYKPREEWQKKAQLEERKARAKADTRSGAEKKAELLAKREAKKAADKKSGE